MMTQAVDPARDVLTQAEAEARAARVSNTSYDLAVTLTKGSPTYRGEVVIRFDVTGEGDLFLDDRGKSIETLEVNGRRIEPNWNGYRLWLPGDTLAPQTTVRIVYENEYDHTGDGLHQFIDPEDGQEYVYTNFEPYEAHRLFPCFDQPDIKATYTLTVTAPAEWEVVSNSRESGSRPGEGGATVHSFETSKPFSTYLFALVAGPYHVVRDEHQGIPLGIYCRKSLARHLDSDELFTLTKQGLDFYTEFFAYPYPFGKYDQLFVPEFNPGAMENVGAVTFNESYIFRDPPTESQRMGRAETLLHEMAHMWFGDLVTMKWWNDLWLNESFATYMSFLAISRATRFANSWTAFNSDIKAWAYRQDQLVTTHPIAGQVADTEQTYLNFDGITYGKGASVLKQLVAAIGLDRFRDGMRRYFQRYQYGNATLSQFLDALGEGGGRDLQAWARAWLETPSLNTIGTTWETDGDRISRMQIVQTAPPEYPTLRPHYMEVGLARENHGILDIEPVPALIDGPEAEVTAVRGSPVPALVFPNYNDLDYAKTALDPQSLAFLRGNLQRFTDPLMRQLLWSSLWDMVRDQKLSSIDFLALAREQIPYEPDREIVQSTIDRAVAAMARYVPDSRRYEEFHAFFALAWNQLQAAEAGDPQIIWARTLIGTAVTPEDLAVPIRLADGTEAVPGLTLDQDMRWSIAVKSMAFGLDGARERVAAEGARDPSDRGQRATLQADTAWPSAEVKATAWERFNGEGYGSLKLTAAAMAGFHWYVQRELLLPYDERFFAAVPAIFDTRDHEFATTYFRHLFPGYRVEQGVLDRSEHLLAELGDRNPRLTRLLREANDDLIRALRCRAFAEA